MTTPVFLDTGIFVALLNRRDRWHEQAMALFGGPPSRWCTSPMVASEGYSWFLHRMGEEAARTFRQLLDSLDDLRMFEATLEHHRQVAKMLDRFRGSKLSYVDASSLCLLDEHGIGRVWSTDHHLGLTGAEILPRS
jgi:predicted nucleic acid-binding protein